MASAALAFCKGSREAEVTIGVHWPQPPADPPGPPIISVGQKDFDPIPCVYRNGEIEVNVTFSGNVPNNQELTLSDFRALIHVQPQGASGTPGGSWIGDIAEKGLLEIKECSGTPTTCTTTLTQLVFSATAGWSKTIKLEGLRGLGGPRRLITYRLVMGGAGNVLDVAFDPPWGERP
jgi:hypothetical protein